MRAKESSGQPIDEEVASHILVVGFPFGVRVNSMLIGLPG
jgi:hypothetical protein